MIIGRTNSNAVFLHQSGEVDPSQERHQKKGLTGHAFQPQLVVTSPITFIAPKTEPLTGFNAGLVFNESRRFEVDDDDATETDAAFAQLEDLRSADGGDALGLFD